MEISKLIIPAAGFGTRFLPLSKTIPKEMLPLLNKPAIQYIIEEALQSELSSFFIITNKNKTVISNHFDSDLDFKSFLKEKEEINLLQSTNKISRQGNFTYINQSEPLGLGHAIFMAHHSIHKEYFAIALPDDIIFHKQPALAQLIRVARQEKASVIAVQEVPTENISSYGVIAIKKQITPNLFQLSHVIEKPQAKDAPSSLAIIGRYILSHKIFASLEHLSNYTTEDIQLTDAISHMIQQNERVFAYKIQGTRYDIGTPLGWLKAIIGSSIQDPYYGPHIKRFISELNTPDSLLYNPTKIIEHTF